VEEGEFVHVVTVSNLTEFRLCDFGICSETMEYGDGDWRVCGGGLIEYFHGGGGGYSVGEVGDECS